VASGALRASKYKGATTFSSVLEPATEGHDPNRNGYCAVFLYMLWQVYSLTPMLSKHSISSNYLVPYIQYKTIYENQTLYKNLYTIIYIKLLVNIVSMI
jgi:hypothetical protein